MISVIALAVAYICVWAGTARWFYGIGQRDRLFFDPDDREVNVTVAVILAAVWPVWLTLAAVGRFARLVGLGGDSDER